MKRRGEIATVLLVALGALSVGVFAGGWKPLELFRKKPPTAELTALQAKLTETQAQLEAARIAKQQAELAEREKQTEQLRYSQQMQAGAVESLARQPYEHRTPQTALASDLLKRADFALGLAIGSLPVDKQREILSIVDRALSGVESERKAARDALAAKDAELRVVTSERDAIKAELPKLAAKVDAAKAEAAKTQEAVTTVTNEVKVKADALDAEKRKAGSFSAQIDRLWRTIAWIAGGWVFLVYVLPGLIKHLDSGKLKTILRDASGYATAPLLYHDAKKKLSANDPE
jgi:hypothetical protein